METSAGKLETGLHSNQKKKVGMKTFVNQTRYTDSLLHFVSLIDSLHEDKDLYSNTNTFSSMEESTRRELVIKMIQCLSHFTLLSGIHMNNNENQTFASEKYHQNQTDFMLQRIIPIQQKLMNSYTYFHGKWIKTGDENSVKSSEQKQQEDLDAMLFMANYQIVLFSQCQFAIQHNNLMPKTEQKKKENASLMKFKIDYINHACKLLNEIYKIVNQSGNRNMLDICPFNSSKKYHSFQVSKANDNKQTISVNVEIKGSTFNSFEYHYDIEDQLATIFAIRALFLKDLYGGKTVGAQSQFMDLVKTNFDQALSTCHFENALVMMEAAKFQASQKSFDVAFVTFFRAAKLASQDDLLKVSCLLLSALSHIQHLEKKKQEIETKDEVIKDLYSEWFGVKPQEQQQFPSVAHFLVHLAQTTQVTVENELKKSSPTIYNHFSTRNRLSQINKLMQEIAEKCSKKSDDK
jgi:hypothetical protein